MSRESHRSHTLVEPADFRPAVGPLLRSQASSTAPAVGLLHSMGPALKTLCTADAAAGTYVTGDVVPCGWRLPEGLEAGGSTAGFLSTS